MLVRAKCFTCDSGFEVVFERELNEHGFYEFPEGHCPNCLGLLDQDVTYSTATGSTITPEDIDNG